MMKACVFPKRNDRVETKAIVPLSSGILHVGFP